MKHPSDKKAQTGRQNQETGRVRTVIWNTVKYMNLIVEQGEQVTLSGRTGAGDCRTYRIEGYD